MKIVRLEVFPLLIALKRPMHMAGRAVVDSRTVVVRLVTTSAEPGWGEANVATALTGETLEDILEALASLEARLRGLDARDLKRLSAIMAAAAPAATSARAAVDMALHDAVARRLGISVSRLLGGDETLAAASIALIDPSEPDWLEESRARVGQGVGLIKLKTANAPVEDEIGFVRAAAAAVGGRASIAVDANGGWSLSEARRFCRGVEGANLLFVEQPLPAEATADMARLATEFAVPLGADEAIHATSDIVRCAREGFARGVSLKLVKAAGLRPVRDAAVLAEALGLSVNLSGKVGETSIAGAANLHLASALTPPRWGVSLTAAYLAHDVVQRPLALTGSPGVLAGSGLGIAVDERRLVDHAIPAPARSAAPAFATEADR